MTVVYRKSDNGEAFMLYDVIDMFTAKNDNSTFICIVHGGAAWLIERDEIVAIRMVDTQNKE